MAVAVGAWQWLRTPCGLRPAPSAQTTSSAHGLGGWSRWRGPAVSPAHCDVSQLRCERPGLARRVRFAHVVLDPKTPDPRCVVCGTVMFAPDPRSLWCPHSPPLRVYPTHPQSRSEAARLQALASEFWPVPVGWIVRTVQNSDRKRCPGSWLRTPRKFQPSQGAQTAPHSHGLGGWLSWAGEFVARQPVAAFH